jgi:Ca-activated chloride channel family protein
VYPLEHPWLLAVLPLPVLVWLLVPPYRETSKALRISFFTDVASVAGLKPAPGAVVLRTNWLQKILAPIVWGLIVVALARPQYVEPPLTQTIPARDLLPGRPRRSYEYVIDTGKMRPLTPEGITAR